MIFLSALTRGGEDPLEATAEKSSYTFIINDNSRTATRTNRQRPYRNPPAFNLTKNREPGKTAQIKGKELPKKWKCKEILGRLFGNAVP